MPHYRAKLSSATQPLDKELIGRRLRAVRDRHGLSQEAFAESVGASKRAYANYERGDREVPIGVVKAVLDLYAVEPIWLLSGPGIEPIAAGAGQVDFRLIVQITNELERQLSETGHRLRDEHKARVVKALYLLALEKGRVSSEKVASVVDVAVARGR